MTQPDACPACGTPPSRARSTASTAASGSSRAATAHAFGHAWERALGRYPGDWVLASLLAPARRRRLGDRGHRRRPRHRDGERTRDDRRHVAGRDRAAGAARSDRRRPTTSTLRPSRSTKARAAAPAAAANTLDPVAGRRNGYTVVLASIPARGRGRRGEREGEGGAARAGSGVGVLDSGKFASLHPGYYVVFAGVYVSLEDEAADARRHGRRALPERVRPPDRALSSEARPARAT